jgi:hypothetical protein
MVYSEGVGKEMAPRVDGRPGTRPTETEETVDEKTLARGERTVCADRRYEGRSERDCFYCLSGWLFLGSIDHDGEEVVESIRCRRCGGTGRISG